MSAHDKIIYDEEKTDSLSENFKEILNSLGEDDKREGLLKTPERAAKAMQFLCKGYDENASDILKSALFKEEYSLFSTTI